MQKKIQLADNEELFDLLHPYKGLVIRCVIMVVVLVALQMIILLSIKPLLNNGIKSTNIDMIALYGVAILCVVALHGVFSIIVARISAKASAQLAEDTRRTLFRKVMTVDEYDPTMDTSGVMVRLMSDVDNVQRFVTDFFRVGLYSVLLSLGIVIGSMFINPVMGLLFLIAAAILYTRIVQVGRRELRSRLEIVTKLETVIRVFRDYVKGARSRRYLGNLEGDREMFSTVSAEYSRVSDNTRIRAYRSSSLMRLMSTVLITILTVLYFVLARSSVVELNTIVMYVQMILLLDSSITFYPFLFETIPIASASAEKIRDVLSCKSERPGIIPEDSGSEAVIRSECPMYPSILRGQETSIITISDTGSWDYVTNIMGLGNTPEGVLYIEDTDVSKIDHTYFPKKIAYAGGNALSFNDTILENIRAWRDIDEEHIRDVCKAVGIVKPLDFVIDRSSSNISLGESFKISIARALVSDTDIYLFDNCFMTLDHDSKRRIVRYIRSTLIGKTVIFISSDTSISDGSDNIAVISGGKVVCNGERTYVIGTNGLYDDLRNARGYADGGY